jgi:hypothetical protein
MTGEPVVLGIDSVPWDVVTVTKVPMVDVSVVDSSEAIDAWDEVVASEVVVMVLKGSVVVVTMVDSREDDTIADVDSTTEPDDDEGGSSDTGDPLIITS